MQKAHTILVGILVACIWTMTINLSTTILATRGEFGLTALGAGEVDENYYFALIRDAATGYPNLGHTSLHEHRNSWTPSTFGPVLQGFFMRITGLDLASIILLGDILFPFVTILMLYLLMESIFKDRFTAVAATCVVCWTIGAGWLRTVNPQISMLISVCYLWFLFQEPQKLSHGLIRGLLLGILTYVQLLYTSFFVILEGCFFLLQVWQKPTQWKQRMTQSALVMLPVAFIALPKFIWLQPSDQIAIADTLARLGVMYSHLPAAPILQGLLLACLIICGLIQWKKPEQRIVIQRSMLLLGAGLIALNQSVIHGKDAILGLYYRPLIAVSMWIAFSVAVLPFFKRFRIAYGVIAIIALGLTARDVLTNIPPVEARLQTMTDTHIPELLEALATLPQESIIAAPLSIADLIPVATDHYVLFSSYARYQHVQDRELAERYLLEQALFGKEEPFDDTYPNVFGLYAGNLSARARTWCRIKSRFSSSKENCNHPTIRESIRHQDVLHRLEDGSPPPSLRDFSVQYLVRRTQSDIELPAECTALQTISDTYSIYQCATSS
jgi:hypothetical protein